MILAAWWTFVYSDLMGENVVLMFLFGWELFMLPILWSLGLVGMVVYVIARGFFVIASGFFNRTVKESR